MKLKQLFSVELPSDWQDLGIWSVYDEYGKVDLESESVFGHFSTPNGGYSDEYICVGGMDDIYQELACYYDCDIEVLSQDKIENWLGVYLKKVNEGQI